jgi:predicted transcriptional regulator
MDFRLPTSQEMTSGMAKYQLTRCEMEIMDIVWERGRATVQDVCDGLKRPLAYTTVMTMLRILESKRNVLTRVKEGRAFVYEPAVGREEVCQSVIRQLKDLIGRGSVKSLVLNLIEDEKLPPDEIEEIKAAIRKLENAE